MARERAGLTQAELARRVGISQPAIQKSEQSVTSTSASRHVATMAHHLGVSARWLGSGEGAIEPSNVSPGPDLRPPVPLVSWVQAGDWTEYTDPYPPGMAEEWISPSTKVSACSFALKVRGDSMEPKFTEGDTLIVDPEVEARNGDFVIVRLDDAQEATFKQLIIDGPQKFLKPLNARYPVVPINGNATIVGVVVEKRQVFLR